MSKDQALSGQRQLTVHNTTSKERANQLEQYLCSLPCDPLLLPTGESDKEPIIKNSCSLDSAKAQKLLVTGQEAVEQIRHGNANGFCIYAGRPSHNTEDLVFTDHDDPDLFHPNDLPKTLLVRSGSGSGFHQTYINSGNVENSQATGALDGAGEIRAHNWYIVTPGSIHPSGGIYYLENQSDPAELSKSHLPTELQPSNPSATTSGDGNQQIIKNGNTELSKQIDQTDIDIAENILNEFSNDYPSAFNCVYDRLDGGRGGYGPKLSRNNNPNKIDRDLQEKTILTHLIGIFRQAGQSDTRSKQLAYQTLSHYCISNSYTKDGEPRKWLKRDNTYRQKQIKHAFDQFDSVEFSKFRNRTSSSKTQRKRSNNEYSEPTEGLSKFIVFLRSNFFHDLSDDQIHELLLKTFHYGLDRDELQALLRRHEKNPPPPHMYNDTTGPPVV